MNYFIIGVLIYSNFANSFSFHGLNSEEYNYNANKSYQKVLRSKRVISKETESPHSKPWMVFLQNTAGSCGGFLVDPHLYVSSSLLPPQNTSDIVLTAAHCVTERNHSIDPTAIIAHFGVHNPYTAEEWVESIRAKAVSIHESYNPEPLSHDIAIIRLSKAIKFSELVQPLNITSLNLTSISNCSISGWGADKNKKFGIDVSHFTPCHMYDRFILGELERFGYLIRIERHVTDGNGALATVNLKDSPPKAPKQLSFLYASAEDGANTTWGDSGGPVVCQKYGKAFAQGIYSGPTDRCRRILHQNCSFIRYERYVNLFQMKSWLLSSMEKIYTMAMHHPELYNYVQFGARNHDIVWSKLINLLWNLFGDVPTEIQVVIESEVLDYHRVWTDNDLQEQVSLDHDVFNPMNIVGYSEEKDVFHCVSACFVRNSLEGCNYVPVFKRCYYLSKRKPCHISGKCIQLNESESVHIYFNKKSKVYLNPYVGGYEIEPSTKPWIVLMQGQSEEFCQGVFIEDQELEQCTSGQYYCILTSRLCFLKMWKAKPKLRFGVHLSNMKSLNEQSADFVKGYDNPGNNLYLMLFQRSSSLNKQIQPIPLSYEKILVGSSLEWLAYGWNLKCPHTKTLHEIPVSSVEATSVGILRVKPQEKYAIECNGENDNAGRPLVLCVVGEENCVLYGISTNVIKEHGNLFQNVTVISDSMSWLQEKIKLTLFA